MKNQFGTTLWILILLLVFVGCSGSNENTSNNSSINDNGERITVSIMTHYFTSSPPSRNNLVQQKIQTATNTNLEIEWVSANNYSDRLNVSLASGNIPDLMLILDPFSPIYKRAIDQGSFWDISPYLDDFPNIKKGIPESAWELTQIDGANYGIPRPRPTEGETFFIIRRDWLHNVGLDIPSTIEDLFEVMRAFTEDDPNQSGKDDTLAFAGYVNPENMGDMGNFISIFNHVNGEWKDIDGKLEHSAFLPETREALEFLAKSYEKGYIAKDFASLQARKVKDMFKEGKTGIINEKSGSLQEYYDQIILNEPEFQFMDFFPLTSINGYNPKGPGFAGVNVISKSVPEEKMLHILGMIDRWMEEDVFSLHRLGVEGVHHIVENGEVLVDTDKMTSQAIGNYSQIVYVSDHYASTVKPTYPDEVQELYRQIQDEREKTSVGNSALGLFTERGGQYLPNLLREIQDLKTRIILGLEPITVWDKFVEELREDQEMVELTHEMNKAYIARQEYLE